MSFSFEIAVSIIIPRFKIIEAPAFLSYNKKWIWNKVFR